VYQSVDFALVYSYEFQEVYDFDFMVNYNYLAVICYCPVYEQCLIKVMDIQKPECEIKVMNGNEIFAREQFEILRSYLGKYLILGGLKSSLQVFRYEPTLNLICASNVDFKFVNAKETFAIETVEEKIYILHS
jgi:hypothetical protein